MRDTELIVQSRKVFSINVLTATPISFWEAIAESELREAYPQVRDLAWFCQKYDEDREEWVDWFDYPDTSRGSGRFTMFSVQAEGRVDA
jgi:hypothetical protein